MQVSRANLADFVLFLAIARHQSFSCAGQEVGISASALSHAIKGLEIRLGVRLLNRSTLSRNSCPDENLANSRRPCTSDGLSLSLTVGQGFEMQMAGSVGLVGPDLCKLTG
jgi:hypothetical protein